MIGSAALLGLLSARPCSYVSTSSDCYFVTINRGLIFGLMALTSDSHDQDFTLTPFLQGRQPVTRGKSENSHPDVTVRPISTVAKLHTPRLGLLSLREPAGHATQPSFANPPAGNIRNLPLWLVWSRYQLDRVVPHLRLWLTGRL